MIRYFRFLALFITFTVLLCSCSNESYIQDIVEEKQSELPIRLDDQTTLIEIKAGENAFIYVNTLIGQSDEDFRKSKATIKETIIKNLKQNMSADIKAIFNRGIHYEYQWLNESRELLFEFRVTAEDLNIKD